MLLAHPVLLRGRMNQKKLAKKMSRICVLLERHGVKVRGEFYIDENNQIKEFSARSVDNTGIGFVWKQENE